MVSAVAFDAFPANVLRAMRGVIVDARLGYPDVLHVEVRDQAGGIWRLASQDAQFSPADPGLLAGKAVEDAGIDSVTGELRVRLSDGGALRVAPTPLEAADDPPSWELITPEGLALEFGPGLRWQISPADRLVGLQRRGRLLAMRMIDERPAEVLERGQAGHWEAI